MKKAKFKDDYKMVAGSCIGHCDQQNSECKNCKIIENCKRRTDRKNYPKSQKQVIEILTKVLKK